MAFKYQDCEYCANHDGDPSLCDNCEDAEEFQPFDEDLASAFQPVYFKERTKEAV